MSGELRDWAEAYPSDLQRWDGTLVNWNRSEWYQSGKNLIGKNYVYKSPKRLSVRNLEDQKLGSGKRLSYETEEFFDDIYIGVRIDMARINAIPIAVEFWVRPEERPALASSEVVYKEGGHKNLGGQVKCEPGVWRRIILRFQSFPPTDKEQLECRFSFHQNEVPANAKGAVQIIPGRVLALKKL